MNEISFLEQLTCEKWTALKFVTETKLKVVIVDRICKAVYKSFNETFAIKEEHLECKGSIRCLNVKNNKEKMAESLAENLSISLELTKKITSEVPVRDSKEAYIELGKIDHPDAYISYISPKSGMLLLRNWQKKSGSRLENSLSSFAAICSTIIDACNKDTIMFSLGCPESRKVGGIEDDQIAVIIPTNLIFSFVDIDKQKHSNKYKSNWPKI